MTRFSPLLVMVFVVAIPSHTQAQALCDSAMSRRPEPAASAPGEVRKVMRSQAEFEDYRCRHLPPPKQIDVPVTRSVCPERVGEACYWYLDHVDPPTEPRDIGGERDRLISRLRASELRAPADPWIVEQLVRYLDESQRPDSALAIARDCHADGWLCEALSGFALHELGRYAAADTAFGRALARMTPEQRCAWRSLSPLLDDADRTSYEQLPCGDPRRTAYEDRAWFFARTLYSLDANDSRTEHYARKMMEQMLVDAPSVLAGSGLRELAVRYGWPRGWTLYQLTTKAAGPTVAQPSLGNLQRGGGLGVCRGCDGRGGSTAGQGDGTRQLEQILHYEPTPAYRYVPMDAVLDNPAATSPRDWELESSPVPSVPSRYSPPYAASLSWFEHQKAMFKRNDTAMVMVAYDAHAVSPLAGGRLTAALVVTPNERPANYGLVIHDAPLSGVLVARAPWGPLLMSAEVYALDKKAVARVRYGISPPPDTGRVILSDLLLFKPYRDTPVSFEEAASHAHQTDRLKANEKLGVYWEAYGTDSTGEKMKISLVVLKESAGGVINGVAQALGLVREPTRVSVSIEDLSTVGTHTTPRALDLDISTLTKGTYVVRLEVSVNGQPVVAADHRIEIIGP